MSARANVVSIEILDNPAKFTDNFKLEVTFECFEDLPEGGRPFRASNFPQFAADLEWKLTYVGSADSNDHDQVLDSILVGPIPEGRHKFLFEV